MRNQNGERSDDSDEVYPNGLLHTLDLLLIKMERRGAKAQSFHFREQRPQRKTLAPCPLLSLKINPLRFCVSAFLSKSDSKDKGKPQDSGARTPILSAE